jgi:hypothetical protein
LTSFSYALNDIVEDSVVVQTKNEEENVENEEENVDEEDRGGVHEDESIEEEFEAENPT